MPVQKSISIRLYHIVGLVYQIFKLKNKMMKDYPGIEKVDLSAFYPFQEITMERIKSDLNEFFFRFNSRRFGKISFTKLTVTIIQIKPLFISQLTT